jgi:hypothetical protein
MSIKTITILRRGLKNVFTITWEERGEGEMGFDWGTGDVGDCVRTLAKPPPQHQTFNINTSYSMYLGLYLLEKEREKEMIYYLLQWIVVRSKGAVE